MVNGGLLVDGLDVQERWPDQWAASLSVLAIIALIAMFFARRLPTQQPSAAPAREPPP
jgi:hypothetical protein